MANILQVGTPVKFQPKAIEGKILEARIIADGIQYRIAYIDWAGMAQERWFREELLTAEDE